MGAMPLSDDSHFEFNYRAHLTGLLAVGLDPGTEACLAHTAHPCWLPLATTSVKPKGA